MIPDQLERDKHGVGVFFEEMSTVHKMAIRQPGYLDSHELSESTSETVSISDETHCHLYRDRSTVDRPMKNQNFYATPSGYYLTEK